MNFCPQSSAYWLFEHGLRRGDAGATPALELAGTFRPARQQFDLGAVNYRALISAQQSYQPAVRTADRNPVVNGEFTIAPPVAK